MIGLNDIVTERLNLRLLPEAGLEATINRDPDTLARLLGCEIPENWFAIARLAQMRLHQLKVDPDYLPWSLRAIILREIGEVAGYVNFHSRPDPQALGGSAPDAIELGYTVFPQYRRGGIARETITALLPWARLHGSHHAILSISPNNIASLALAQSFGFVKVGEQMDDIDGPEDIYLLRL